ncbi:MAG: hypothetical protein ABI999_02695 [Acidobacteriota bacterium]
MIGFVLILSAASFAQAKKVSRVTREERLITALVNSKTIPGLFGGDGFADCDISGRIHFQQADY